MSEVTSPVDIATPAPVARPALSGDTLRGLPLAGPLLAEWRALASMDSLVAEWRDLAARALEPNVFYEPAFALPAAPVFGQDVIVGLVWSQLRRELLGVFPTRVERWRYGMPLPMLTGWTHPYGPLGTPLIDREQAGEVLSAWLRHLAHDAQPSLWLMPTVRDDGPFAQALGAVLARADRMSVFSRHRRAFLSPGGERETYWSGAVASKKRKELRRQRRRLEEVGDVTVDVAIEPAAIRGALQDFFDLETHGWKGRAGTAAAQHDEVRRFVRSAVAELAGEGKARIDRLLLNGAPIAAAVTLRSGDAAWTWKIAYDEAFARASPGVQLMHDLTLTLLADPTIAHTDSCATADHPMIDHLWRERLTLADRLIAIRSRPMTFALAGRLEELRHRAITTGKTWRRRAFTARLRGRA